MNNRRMNTMSFNNRFTEVEALTILSALLEDTYRDVDNGHLALAQANVRVMYPFLQYLGTERVKAYLDLIERAQGMIIEAE